MEVKLGEKAFERTVKPDELPKNISNNPPLFFAALSRLSGRCEPAIWTA